jgi:hypothetical protein
MAGPVGLIVESGASGRRFQPSAGATLRIYVSKPLQRGRRRPLPGQVIGHEGCRVRVRGFPRYLTVGPAGLLPERIGAADANRSDWHAEYMVAEQAGKDLPS